MAAHRVLKAFTGSVPTAAYAMQLALFASPAQAVEVDGACTIVETMISSTRVHFKCQPAVSAQTPTGILAGIVYLALDPSRDAWLAEQAMRGCDGLRERMKMSFCPVTVRFETDPIANPPGCLARDCRKLTAIFIRA